jgi:hypothetical protein
LGLQVSVCGYCQGQVRFRLGVPPAWLPLVLASAVVVGLPHKSPLVRVRLRVRVSMMSVRNRALS